MPLDIKEIFRSDLDPTSPSTWWSSKKIEKLNWNFDQIEEIGGGPLGPQGFAGEIGPEGATGAQGPIGRQGPKGLQGSQGPMGLTNWLANIGSNNITLKIPQDLSNPNNAIIGIDDNMPDYNLVSQAGNTTATKRFHTIDPSQDNITFISSDVDGSNTNLASRKKVSGNLFYDADHSKFELGFKNITNANEFNFKLSNAIGSNFSFRTRDNNVLPMFEFNSLLATINRVTEFNGISQLNGVNKFSSQNPNLGYIAYTDSNDLGRVKWGDPKDIIGGFPIGSIIAIDSEFKEPFFDLVDTLTSGTLSIQEQALVTGYATGGPLGGPTVPTFKFTYGRGKGKFKGWYLCHGRKWYKGGLTYDVPNLCSFDLTVDYPEDDGSFNLSVAQLLQTTPRRQILASAVLKFVAALSNTTYTFSNGTSGTNVLESYIDSGEPNIQIYNGSTGDQRELKMGPGKGLVYVVYLGEEDMIWDTSEEAPILNDLLIAYSQSSVSSACSNSESLYKTNFTTAWNDSGTWTTNGNRLFNSNGIGYAPSGYYEKLGIVRYWNSVTGTFTSRQACPSFTQTQLAYNISVTAAGINGPFSGLSKSTYFINGASLSSATAIYTNSGGTTLATAGWYRDSGIRRYWDGGQFVGAAPTLDYVRYLSGLSWGTTSTEACNVGYFTYGYYQSSSSSTLSFSSISTLLTNESDADGETPLYFAVQGRYYGDGFGSNYRIGINSNTGALGSTVSCFSTFPSGGGSGGGGCLLYGTKILMSDGSFKFIQDLKINDVLSSLSFEGMPIKETEELFNWSSKEAKLSKDTVILKGIKSINVNTVYSINDGKLFASVDHLHLFKHNSIWKIAQTDKLSEGDFLMDQNGNEVEIFNIIKVTGNFIVYKLDVEENDLFIANGILTHNLKFKDSENIQL